MAVISYLSSKWTLLPAWPSTVWSSRIDQLLLVIYLNTNASMLSPAICIGSWWHQYSGRWSIRDDRHVLVDTNTTPQSGHRPVYIQHVWGLGSCYLNAGRTGLPASRQTEKLLASTTPNELGQQEYQTKVAQPAQVLQRNTTNGRLIYQWASNVSGPQINSFN